MGKEIERKFLVTGNGWRNEENGKLYRQGYLSRDKKRIVRVRSTEDRGFLTIKGLTVRATRAEFEYEIPLADANEIMEHLCDGQILEKKRYRIEIGSSIWEVDEFLGENSGLIVAEIELSSEDEEFKKPCWVGTEVTGEARYYNSNLIERPFSTW